MNRRYCLLGCLTLGLLVTGYVASHGVSQEGQPGKEKPKKPEGKPAPATVKVEKGPFKIEVAIKGVFEAEGMTPLVLSPEVWNPNSGNPLVVLKAVEHGARVRKGDTLIWLDLEKIDQNIRDLEAERQLAELAITLAEKELPILEQSTPKDLAVAERARKIADEDLQQFLEKGRAFAEKIADYQLKSAHNYLDYAKEELAQLEKMYKANDLTEETEKIVLRRYRNYVEGATFWLKLAEKERDDAFKFELPRRDQALREKAEKEALALDKARATLPLTLTQKRLSLTKLKYDQTKAADKLARLRRDREILTAKAPADGIVYYGRCVRGHWTTASTMADKLQRGGQLAAEEVILTIVQPKGLFVRADIEEKELHQVRPTLAARVIPTGLPDVKLKARIEDVSTLPITPGKFLARLHLDMPAGDSSLVPGMACSIKLIPYQKSDALTVPAASVFTDELDEDKHHVYVPATGGKSAKRSVTIGKKSGDRMEILQGLKAGEAILREKPGTDTKTVAASKED